MLTVFQAFSQFERDLIVERTMEGLRSTHARGRMGGRPRVNKIKVAQAIKLYNSRDHSINDIEEMTGISRSTLYRYLKAEK